MTKALKLLLVSMLLLSSQVFAQECASNINSLKNLVGNSDLPLNWLEKGTKNPLTLNVRDGGGALLLRLRTQDGEWAKVTGVVCKKGLNKFVARVSTMEWGPAAPKIAKGMNIKEITLKLPYQSILIVSVSLMNFEFNPLQ